MKNWMTQIYENSFNKISQTCFSFFAKKKNLKKQKDGKDVKSV